MSPFFKPLQENILLFKIFLDLNLNKLGQWCEYNIRTIEMEYPKP
ncbi:MAG: hypothetical protein U9Q62_10760 [Campylobacterota bacterium]|nr:hypothetical protein [Campylobacterota bacterium]